MYKLEDIANLLYEEWLDTGVNLGRIRIQNRFGLSEINSRLVSSLINDRINDSKSIVEISGYTVSSNEKCGDDILEDLIEEQKGIEETVKSKYNQSIKIKKKEPFSISFISDIHLGNKGVNYKGLKEDVQVITGTKNMFSILAGDIHDNWIVHSLQKLQRGQAVSFDKEIQLVKWLFNELDDSLIAYVSGNHDNWTKGAAGYDFLRDMLSKRALYGEHEINFTLETPSFQDRYKIRHSFSGKSVHNISYGMEKDLKFGDSNYDVAIQGHTHEGTLFREGIYKGEKKLFIMLGTYKFSDDYQEQCGFPRTLGDKGCATIVYDTDGTRYFFDEVKQASKFLKFLRG